MPKLREEANAFEGQRREISKAVDAAKAELKVRQENHILTNRSLKVKMEKVKRLKSNLEKAALANDSYHKKWEEERQRKSKLHNENRRLQFELTAMHQNMEAL